MQSTNSKRGYGAVPQILHWLTALFVICGWLLGQFLDDLPKGSIRSPPGHPYDAWAIRRCDFLIARLVWRMANPPPPPEPTRFGRL